MCDLTATKRSEVEAIVEVFVLARKIFTGRDVAEATRILGASPYVRELFNSGKMPGYCSTTVRPEPDPGGRPWGPVLYFPQPFWIEKRAHKIRADIEAAARAFIYAGSGDGETGECDPPLAGGEAM